LESASHPPVTVTSTACGADGADDADDVDSARRRWCRGGGGTMPMPSSRGGRRAAAADDDDDDADGRRWEGAADTIPDDIDE